MATTEPQSEAAKADKARREGLSKEQLSELKEQAEWNTGLIGFSYEQVLDATKHQDDKIGRLLTAVAFLTAGSLALAGLDSAGLISTRITIDGNLSAPLGIWFFAIFLVAVIVAVIQLIGSLSTPLRLPGLNPSRKSLRDGSGASTIYFNEIERASLETWRRRWDREADAPFDFIDDRRRHLINETHNLAVRTAFKYNRTTEAIAIFTWALTSLACAVAVVLIVARNRAFGPKDAAWVCDPNTLTTVSQTTTAATTNTAASTTIATTTSSAPVDFGSCQLILGRTDLLILAAVAAAGVLTFAIARLRYDAPGVDDRRPFGQAWMHRTFVLGAFVATLLMIGFAPVMGQGEPTIAVLAMVLSIDLGAALLLGAFNLYVADRGDRWSHDAPQQSVGLVLSLLYLPLSALLLVACFALWPDTSTSTWTDILGSSALLCFWLALTWLLLREIATGRLAVKTAGHTGTEAGRPEGDAEAEQQQTDDEQDGPEDHWGRAHRTFAENLEKTARGALAFVVVIGAVLVFMTATGHAVRPWTFAFLLPAGLGAAAAFAKLAGLPSALRAAPEPDAVDPEKKAAHTGEAPHHLGTQSDCPACESSQRDRTWRNLLYRVTTYAVLMLLLGLGSAVGMLRGSTVTVIGCVFVGLTALFASAALEPTFRGREARFQADLSVTHADAAETSQVDPGTH